MEIVGNRTEAIQDEEFKDVWNRYFCSTSVMNPELATINLHIMLGQFLTVLDNDNRRKMISAYNLQPVSVETNDDDDLSIDDLEMGDNGKMVIPEKVDRPSFDEIDQSIFNPVLIQFRKTVIDCRIHGQYIQDSGTGKSEGNGVTMSTGSVLGITVSKLSSTTDAGLIGDNENETGALSEAEIIMVDEAQEFYADGGRLPPDKLKMRDHLNESMNCAGSWMSVIKKKLKHETFYVYPLATILLTSYETDSMFSLAQSAGFFQRALTFNRELSFEEYMLMQELHTLGQYIDPITKKRITYTKKQAVEDKEVIFKHFNKIKEFIEEASNWKHARNITPDLNDVEGSRYYIPVRIVDFTDTPNLSKLSTNFLMRFSMHYTELVATLSDEVKNYTKTFFSRMKMHMLRLAMHHAIMNLRNIPTVKDFEYAQTQVQYYIENIIEWVEKWSEKDKKVTAEADRRKLTETQFITVFNSLFDYFHRRSEFDSVDTSTFPEDLKCFVEYCIYFSEKEDLVGYYPLKEFKQVMEKISHKSESSVAKKWGKVKHLFNEKRSKGNRSWIRPKEIPEADLSITDAEREVFQ